MRRCFEAPVTAHHSSGTGSAVLPPFPAPSESLRRRSPIQRNSS